MSLRRPLMPSLFTLTLGQPLLSLPTMGGCSPACDAEEASPGQMGPWSPGAQPGPNPPSTGQARGQETAG